MTICRYYAQGYCRFGSRCRFEHVESNYNNQQSHNYNQRNAENYQQRHGRQESGYSNSNQYRNERYDARNNYNDDYRGYSPERRTENYRYQSGGYDNQQHYYGGGNQKTRYNEHNYGRKQQQFSDYRENENIYGHNRYQWLAEDYKNQGPNTRYSENEYADNSYSTSTPKGKPSFSFKVPESEIKKGSSTYFQVNEQDQLLADNVKEDAKSWEFGGQWPFTCYFPYPNKSGFPGFYDVSPEELRYAAYKAEKSNTYNTYLQSVQNALTQVNQQRSQLLVATPQLLSTIRRIRNGEDVYSTSKVIDPLSSVHSDDMLVSMETPAIAIQNAAASFSFKMPTETDSAIKTSASNFSFKLPADTEIKAVSTSVSDGDADVYTAFGNLTNEEREQFSASTFVLGKIPTNPPPLLFCT